MRITKRQLRRIIREFKEGAPRSASEVLELVVDLAMKMATNRGMSAEDLNGGGFQALMDEAFEEINPSEFPSRSELSQTHSREIDDMEARYLGGKNEGKMKITKRQLRRIIKEEKAKLLSEQVHQMYQEDDELRQLGEIIENLMHYALEGSRIMDDMGMRYGELVGMGTDARIVKNSIRELADKFDMALDNIVRYR